MPVRVIQVAQDAVTFQMLAGTESAVNGVRRRAGRILDPKLVDTFCKSSHTLFDHLNPPSLWNAVLTAEPGAPALLADEHFDNAMRAVADFTDMKSPYFTGHSRAVGELAARAAHAIRLPETDVRMLRHAGLIHDIGCVGVSAALWNKAGALTESEWERVRLHTNFTERIFARSSALSPTGDLAALHHERLDGSGYHRRLPAMLLSLPARLLAVADVYCAMTEPRPHRPALLPEQAADELRGEVKAGRLDIESVNAALEAAGHEVERPSQGAASNLTPRELEVIRLMARGCTTKGIAYQLSITSKTADHHIQNIYGKIGLSTRAGATLYAMQNNLL